MEGKNFHQTEHIWEKGRELASNFSSRTSLHKLNDRLYVIFFTDENRVDKIKEVTTEQARDMFPDFIE